MEEHRTQRLAGLSSWFKALDGFLGGTTAEDRLDVGRQVWEQFQPALKLPSSVPKASLNSSTDSTLNLATIAEQALNELAMLALGIPSPEVGGIHISHLPAFVDGSISLLEMNPVDPLGSIAELHGGANPLRLVLAFLSTLNARDREAFRLIAGIKLDAVFNLLDFTRFQEQAQGRAITDQSSTVDSRGASTGNFGSFPRALVVRSGAGGLLEAERLLSSWRSSRLRSGSFQPGSLAHAEAKPAAGKYLAELLDSVQGPVIFNPGWAGERFAQDAKRDLTEAWSGIGRAVAVDLRREAAPWLARRLGTSTAPAFSLEYSVQPSPSNTFKALMTMRLVAAGVSYGIPYQVAARALGAASAEYFDNAPVPLRYVEEPHQGLRIYIPRDPSDTAKATAELEADLVAAYPPALSAPAVLLAISSPAGITHADFCIALDGAYREVAVGVRLARLFTALLHSRGYPELASLVVKEVEGGKD